MRCFELNLIEKSVIFLASFCWLWDFLLENLKSRKNSDVHWNVRKKVVCSKKYFQKKNSRYELLNHLQFVSNFIFWETAKRRFSQCFLYFFLMMLNIWLHRKVVLVICCFYKKVVWKWCHPRHLKRHFLPFEVFEILWWTIFSWTGICLLQNQFISWRSD